MIYRYGSDSMVHGFETIVCDGCLIHSFIRSSARKSFA